MKRLIDGFALWAFRALANAMLLAGMAVFVAGFAAHGLSTGWPAIANFLAMLFQVGGVFIVAGALAIYLTASRRTLLPNEGGQPRPGGTEPGGWIFGLAAALAALPFWLLLALRPFLAEWARLIDLMERSGIWEGTNANGSGLILVPIAAALTPPFFELAAMALFVAASSLLLALLVTRSRRFPRLYLVSAILLSALVFASMRGAAEATSMAAALRPLFDGATEVAMLSDGLDRYVAFVNAPIPILLGALGGYLVWTPAMVLSARVRTTFAPVVQAPDIVSITHHPRHDG
ncbi:hypothetical protein LJR225_001883 [Phenylobacterium sp. LjRoot225]|uniref:hypothetical protein n=1 Tax=Phenylobacterium sp. LjRoot225 TaxID=3342285 RepID=UPI003ECD5B83